MDGMGAEEFENRVRRLEAWTGDESFALGSCDLSPAMAAALRPDLAVSESLYRPLEAGLTVLESGLDPVLIDSMAKASGPLARAEADYARRLADGADVWVRAGGRSAPPSERSFRPADERRWGGKPTGGLFTSRASKDHPGAWFAYLLDNVAEFPHPWNAWSLTTEATRTRTISSAVEWCAFVDEYRADDAGHADWRAASADLDAVRLTPAAVFAIDGCEFVARGRAYAATWWTCETTVWLHWRFDNVEPYQLPSAQ